MRWNDGRIWAVAALAVAGCQPPGAKAVKLDTAAARRGDVEKSVESAAKVISNLDVEIKCRASGPVAKLPVDISQHVKAGQLLCQLDPTDQQLEVNKAERTLTQTKAKQAQAEFAYEQAKLNLESTRARVESALTSANVKAANLRAKADRQKQLVDQKLGSAEEYETAQTDAAAAADAAESAKVAVNELKQQELQLKSKELDVTNAAAQVDSDTFNLDTLKQQLAYTTVTSPLDGVVSALNVQSGSMVQSGTGGFSGGTTVMTISDLSHIYAMATVDQSDFGGIQLDQPAKLSFDSYPDRTFVGKVVRKATTGVNTSNVVTFEVKIEVTDADKNLLSPVMTGTATIIESERKNVLTVPTAAITHKGADTLVKLADGTDRKVTAGLSGNDVTEITAGLAEGEKVQVAQQDLPTRWKSELSGPK